MKEVVLVTSDQFQLLICVLGTVQLILRIHKDITMLWEEYKVVKCKMQTTLQLLQTEQLCEYVRRNASYSNLILKALHESVFWWKSICSHSDFFLFFLLFAYLSC